MSITGDRINDLMRVYNITYGDVERGTGIPKSATYRYANAQTDAIPSDRIAAYSRFFCVTTDYLLGTGVWSRDFVREWHLAGHRYTDEMKSEGYSIDEVAYLDITKDESPDRAKVAIPQREVVREIPVYGPISCGTGLFVEDSVINHIQVPVSMLPNKNAEYFAQYASGDSMIGVGIDDGDLIIFRKVSTIESGKVGCFCVDNESAVCKIFSQSKGNVVLLPANPKYDPIIVDPSNTCFRVVGQKVLKLTRD